MFRDPKPHQIRTRSQTAKASSENDQAQALANLKGKSVGLAAKPSTGTLNKKPSTTALATRGALQEKAVPTAANTKKRNLGDAEKSEAKQIKPAKTTTTRATTQRARKPVQEKPLPALKEEASGDQENVGPPSENVDPKPDTKVKRRAPKAEQAAAPPKATAARTKKPVLKEKVVAPKDELAGPPSKKAKVEEAAQDWDDLDAEDIVDPLMVSEYVTEIFEYMKDLEVQTLPNPNYMEDQKELQWKMRTILIDWLIEVHNKFRLLPETLYLAVNIIDRFLSMRVVSLVKLQLVGVTAMFIAAKYEEICAPSIESFIYIAEGGYSDDEILKAERYVLQVLDFSLQYPSPLSFLRRCSKADNYDPETRTMAKYLMEISLVDHRFLPHPPSQVAAAGLYLARKILRDTEWDANLTHYSGYKEAQLMPCVRLMVSYLESPMKFEALFKKYASRKFLKVSMFVKERIERGTLKLSDFPEETADLDDDYEMDPEDEDI
ncbi:G2/mitotic-specific cyclin [Rhizophlyctis rosea]|nr:G2/mitotic-specific cyclin [Rhizophlyctis rosea]